MVEGLTRQISAEEYWRSGGKLNRDSFEKAVAVLLKQANGEKPVVSNSSSAQVENMARFSKVPITLEQKYLYAVLSEMRRKPKGKSDSPPEKPETMPPLCDQPLLAEVIRLTDEKNLDSFMRAYPNIFNK